MKRFIVLIIVGLVLSGCSSVLLTDEIGVNVHNDTESLIIDVQIQDPDGVFTFVILAPDEWSMIAGAAGEYVLMARAEVGELFAVWGPTVIVVTKAVVWDLSGNY